MTDKRKQYMTNYMKEYRKTHATEVKANTKRYRDANRNKVYISNIKSYFKKLTGKEKQDTLNELFKLFKEGDANAKMDA